MRRLAQPIASRALLAVVALAALAGCDADPVEAELETARKAGQEAGFAEGQRKGFEMGLAEGRERGFERGRKEGRAGAFMRWGPVGAGVGLLLGLGIGLWVRRESLAAERSRRARAAALQAAFGRLPGGLDSASRARLESILSQKQALETAMAAATSASAAELSTRLRPRLERLGQTIVELSELTSRLRAALRDTPAKSERDIEARATALAEETDPHLKAALEANITAQRRALDARNRAEAGLTRCEVQLEAIEAFLGHARISVATLQADVGDAVAELGAEVEAITDAVAVARAELAAI